MPTFAQIPIDIKWMVQLASGTTYSTYGAALAAAVALSAGNGNAPASIFTVEKVINGPDTGAAPDVSHPSAYMGSDLWMVQLTSATTYYPEAVASQQGRALSQSNGNAPVNIGRPYISVTSP